MRLHREGLAVIHLIRWSLVAFSLLTPCGFAPDEQSNAVRPLAAAEKEIVFWGAEDEWIEAIAVSADGSVLATLVNDMSGDGMPQAAIRLWDISARRVRFSATLGEVNLPTCGEMWDALRRSVDRIWQIAFSPDGGFLAAGAYGCFVVKSWEVATGRECLNLPLADLSNKSNRLEKVRRLWFSANGRTLTVYLDRGEWTDGFGEHSEETWVNELVSVDTASWRVRSRRVIPGEDAYAMALRPDGMTFLAANHGGRSITLTDLTVDPPRLAERQPLMPPVLEQDPGSGVWFTFSPDGSAVVYSGQVFRWVDGKAKGVLLKDDDPHDFDSMTFSPDGRLVCGTRSYTVETLAAKLPMAVKDWLRRFVQVPESRVVGETLVWDTATGRLRGFRKSPEWSPRAIAIFPGNEKVVLSDGTDALLWRLPAK